MRIPHSDDFPVIIGSIILCNSLKGRIIAVVHTEREDYTRIISVRKATKYEQQTYFKQLSN